MAISKGRLNGLRVVLGLITLFMLLGFISDFFFTKSSFEGSAPAGEKFSNYMDWLFKGFSAFELTWAVAAALAFRNVLKNLGLLQAIIAALGIVSVITAYANLAVADSVSGFMWVITGFFVVFFVALLALYPRGQQAS